MLYSSKRSIIRFLEDSLRVHAGEYLVRINVGGNSGEITHEDKYMRKMSETEVLKKVNLNIDVLRRLPRHWVYMSYISHYQNAISVFNVDKEVALAWARKNHFQHSIKAKWINSGEFWSYTLTVSFHDVEISFSWYE